jgi:hypothetical protein
MFEHRSQSLLPRRAFVRRVIRYGGFALGIVAGSLGLGVAGYHGFEGMGLVDAIVNASMILGGMGPVSPLRTEGGKLFASFYALFSGMVFLIAVGVLFAPIMHRFYHRFHVEFESEQKTRARAK